MILFLLASLLFGDLTLEQKVGQMLVVHFEGEAANEDSQRLIEEAHVGGFILYQWSNGLTSPEQVKTLTSGLQKQSDIPLIICTDQEGGRVSRLTTGFTSYPSAQSLGQKDDSIYTEKMAYNMALEMKAVGINLNLAPVVDIHQDGFIKDRSFGSNAQIVTKHAQAVLQGFARAGVACTLKHYPGHGSVQFDTHEGLGTIHKPLEEDLYPFQNLTAPVVMTGHINVPLWDVDNCATLSPKILSALRSHHSGLIMSDSLVMKGLLQQAGTPLEAAIRAINAGCDLLCLGGKLLNAQGQELSPTDVIDIHRGLVEAVKTGKIAEQRIEESLRRLESFKASLR